MTAVMQDALLLVPSHVVVPLPGADDDRDAGVLLRPRDPAGVLERLLGVLHARPDLRAEWDIAARAGDTTRGRANSAWALSGTTSMADTSGHTTGPPPENA